MYDELIIDEKDKPIIYEDECRELKKIVEEYMKEYAKNHDKEIEEWLIAKMHEDLPEKSIKEIKEMVNEITSTIKYQEEKRKALVNATSKGMSKEGWFAKEMKEVTSVMTVQESVKYLNSLDLAMKEANDSLSQTVFTQLGKVNQNPNLDGFIAEQYHAQTFNMNAQAKGSEYRAEVLQPKNGVYKKNSVDIVIKDKNGNIVRRYQSKYCKDAKATEQALKKGDYRGQRALVPEEQNGDILRKTTDVLEAPDGTTSNSLIKERAESLRDEAQNCKLDDLVNWNEYATKDLAINIGKQAGKAAVQGAIIGVGIDVAQKLYNGEDIDADEVVETAIESGVDVGVKSAVSGALKVASEKGVISALPKGTPVSTFANIAHVAVENLKVVNKMADGEYSFKEGMEEIEKTTVSAVAGIIAMEKGAIIGASIGTVLGPVGQAVGGFVGGVVGYACGSKVGEKIVKTVQKVRDKARTAYRKAHDLVASSVSRISNFVTGIFA